MINLWHCRQSIITVLIKNWYKIYWMLTCILCFVFKKKIILTAVIWFIYIINQKKWNDCVYKNWSLLYMLQVLGITCHCCLWDWKKRPQSTFLYHSRLVCCYHTKPLMLLLLLLFCCSITTTHVVSWLYYYIEACLCVIATTLNHSYCYCNLAVLLH